MAGVAVNTSFNPRELIVWQDVQMHPLVDFRQALKEEVSRRDQGCRVRGGDDDPYSVVSLAVALVAIHSHQRRQKIADLGHISAGEDADQQPPADKQDLDGGPFLPCGCQGEIKIVEDLFRAIASEGVSHKISDYIEIFQGYLFWQTGIHPTAVIRRGVWENFNNSKYIIMKQYRRRS